MQLKIGTKGFRRSQSGGDVYDTWEPFIVNETYLELIAEFPEDYKFGL